MKKTLLLAILLALAVPLMAEDTYQVVTKDNEVTDINQVQVQRLQDAQIATVYTVRSLTNERQALLADIAIKQARVVEINALLAKVAAEAAKVKLAEPATKP
uniref:Uncharacterized protein n=1 Tax=viral metagenome TaxID=1070528 RepID=A0A6M3JH19_9ZZZZ